MLPLVSIVTPVYNGGRYLQLAIESILNQDYPNIEYIVLDDGSNDNTPDILRSYSGRLRWESHPNKGQAYTLNKGWQMSSGELLGYLSADDILLPNAISEMVEILSQNSQALVAYPNCDLIDSQGRIVRREVARPFNYSQLIFHQEVYIGPGAVFRRSVIEKVGGWKPEFRISPDREFWMRVGLEGEFIMCPKVLAYYRLHLGSLSYFQKCDLLADEPIRMIKDYFKRTDLPSEIKSNKRLALSRAYIISGRLHLKFRRIRQCLKRLNMAKIHNPNINLVFTSLTLIKNWMGFEFRKFIWTWSDFFIRKTRSCE